METIWDKIASLAEAAKATDTEPTESQKKAGNYKKGKVRIQGLAISIENPKGSYRSGTDPNGKAWRHRMPHHYGYFLGTKARDKDQVDCFIGPHSRRSDTVYVIDQIDPKTGKYDEPKVMLGFLSESSARYGYMKAYDRNWKGLGAITPMPLDEFKQWLFSPASRKSVAL